MTTKEMYRMLNERSKSGYKKMEKFLHELKNIPMINWSKDAKHDKKD